MKTVRGAMAGLLACALLVTTTGGTVEAAVTVKQVGGNDRAMWDMTPDGRYVLLDIDEGWDAERVDRQTGRRVRVPFRGELTADGANVVGVDPVNNRVTRYHIASGLRRTYPLPSRDDWAPGEVSVSADGSRIGVNASSAPRAEVRLFIINERTRRIKRIDHLAPGSDRFSSESTVTFSHDGRVAAFDAGHQGGGYRDVFVYVEARNKVFLASRAWNGKRTYTGNSIVQDVSGDGRFVLFWSEERGLIKGYEAKPRYYLRDRTAGRTIHLRIPTTTYPSPWDVPAVINHNGRRIAFPLEGTIRHGGRNHRGPVVGYLNRDTRRVSKLMKTINGRPPNSNLFPFGRLTMDAYGVRVGFTSDATNLTRRRGDGVRAYVSTVS